MMKEKFERASPLCIIKGERQYYGYRFYDSMKKIGDKELCPWLED